jgi:deazaflavin-dependent oxidoreductase (nitroreductase family)
MSTVARIPAFDPSARRGPLYRALNAVLRTRPGRWLGVHVAARVDPLLLSLTRGRLGVGLVLPTAGLTTTGARSGAPRTAAVLYFTDGADVILIASNFGRDRHPAWYHNLIAHPEAVLERGGRRATYVATEVTDPDEHERLFGLAESVYPGYADYRAETAALGRRIPVMRCTPAL